MIRRYKEIWYGLLIGLTTWSLDAMMHASMHGHLTWGNFSQELLSEDITQLFFRTLFILISVALGFALWRSNQRKYQVEDLQLTLNSLHRQVVSPLLLITGYCRLLSLKEGWPVSKETIEMIEKIQLNAEQINDIIKQLPPPGAIITDNKRLNIPIINKKDGVSAN